MNRIKKAIIVFCCALSSLFVTSCFPPLSYEKFHKPVVVDTQPQKKAYDANGNLYTYNIQSAKGTKYFPDGLKETFDIKIDFSVTSKEIFDLCSNKTHIFVGVYYYIHKDTDFEFLYKIHIYDKNMSELKIIDTGKHVVSIVANDSFLYCCYSEYDSATDSYNYGLLKYSLNDFEETILPNRISINDYYLDDETIVFLQQCNPFSNHYNLCLVDDGFFLTSEKNFTCFHPKIGLVSVTSNPNKISISYLNKNLEFDIPFQNSSFYNYVYVEGDYVIFGLKEFLENEECVPDLGHYGNCICHYGQSLLMKYDLKKDCFLETMTYSYHTVLIDYDFNGAYYYFDGGLYNHGVLVKECEKLETNETIIITGGYYVFAAEKYLSLVYFDNKFYGL